MILSLILFPLLLSTKQIPLLCCSYTQLITCIQHPHRKIASEIHVFEIATIIHFIENHSIVADAHPEKHMKMDNLFGIIHVYGCAG